MLRETDARNKCNMDLFVDIKLILTYKFKNGAYDFYQNASAKNDLAFYLGIYTLEEYSNNMDLILATISYRKVYGKMSEY